jgi:ABC-type Mn2+/Zn2+ transport system ATPase subunit
MRDAEACSVGNVEGDRIGRYGDRTILWEMAWEKLETIGLANVAKSAFRTLSGGEAQRLILERGIAATPQLSAIIAG